MPQCGLVTCRLIGPGISAVQTFPTPPFIMRLCSASLVIIDFECTLKRIPYKTLFKALVTFNATKLFFFGQDKLNACHWQTISVCSYASEQSCGVILRFSLFNSASVAKNTIIEVGPRRCDSKFLFFSREREPHRKKIRNSTSNSFGGNDDFDESGTDDPSEVAGPIFSVEEIPEEKKFKIQIPGKFRHN